MAINDNFVFSDPALQAQVVNAAQVRAAENAARAQQFAEAQRALRADRQLAMDREERRAERDRIISEGQARTAESKRQFDESLKFNREDAASRTSAVAAQRKEAEQREQYTAILRAIEAADGRSLPTAKELEARTADLLPQHRQLLQEARGRRAAQLTSDFGLIATEAERLNGLIGTDSGDGKKWTADRLLRGSQFKGNLLIGPDGRIQSLAIRPRDDVMPGAAPSPAPAAPTVSPVTGVEPVKDVLQRAQPGMLMRGANEVADLVVNNRLGELGSRAADALGRGVSDLVGGTLAPFRVPAAPSGSPVMELSPVNMPFEGRIPFRVPAAPSGSPVMELSPVNMPFEGRIPFRVPAAPSMAAAPDLIPAEMFDVSPGGFTGGERLMQRGMRLIESRPDAALRRLSEARKTYPEAELVERPDGIFISPVPRRFYAPPAPASDLLAAPVFAPSY